MCRTLEKSIADLKTETQQNLVDFATKLEVHLLTKQEQSQETFSKSVWNLLRKYQVPCFMSCLCGNGIAHN